MLLISYHFNICNFCQNITQEEKEQKDKESWKKWLSEYMELVEVDAVAHVDIKTYWEQRVQLMNSNNPR